MAGAPARQAFSALKKSGSIEANAGSSKPARTEQFSALKKSGSIEARVIPGGKPWLMGFSALKKSGSIEADSFYRWNFWRTRRVFRFEKKRLH